MEQEKAKEIYTKLWDLQRELEGVRGNLLVFGEILEERYDFKKEDDDEEKSEAIAVTIWKIFRTATENLKTHVNTVLNLAKEMEVYGHPEMHTPKAGAKGGE